MVIEILSIINLSFGDIVFLSFIALIIVINLIRFFCYYVILSKLLGKQSYEKKELLGLNKYKFIFSKDWFEDEGFEYRRIQAREALTVTIVFSIGFVMAFCMFAFYGK